MIIIASLNKGSNNSASEHLTHYSVNAIHLLLTEMEVDLSENLKAVFLHQLNNGHRTMSPSQR